MASVFAKGISYSNVIIESDARVVMDWFTARNCTLWYFCDFWEDCIKEIQWMNLKFNHEYREGNQVTDFIACMGESGHNEIYDNVQNLLH